MAITLSVGGRRFEGWLGAVVATSMDSIAGTFTVNIALTDVTNLPILLRERVLVFVDGKQVIDGFVERINGSYSAGNDVISFSGRDKTADIVDSQIGDKVDIKGAISFVDIIKQTLITTEISGIDVINNVPDIKDFGESDIIAPEIGQNLFDFFNDYAAKRQVFLITDGLGNITINRETSKKIRTPLLHRVGVGRQNTSNNILSGTWSYDDSLRFNLYKVLSQSNMSATADTSEKEIKDEDVKNITDIQASVTDESIRSGRQFVMKGERPLNKSECEDRAKWQLSVKRARSFNYSVRVDLHSHSDDIWRPNRLVKVSDQRAGIDGEYLINEVEYRTDSQTGQTTLIGIVDKNKYNLELQASAFKQQTTKQGEKEDNKVVLDCSKLKGIFLKTAKDVGFCD